ncbi:MAG: OmpA family protein [Polyangiaceae bacterium]|jgi:peptidoglycan-associated lipoprotein|nr:OmpA family protein [Polyangiaceae bacterium]
MKRFFALAALAALACACDSKPEPTSTPSPVTGLPSNTGVLTAKPTPDAHDAPAVAVTTAGVAPANSQRGVMVSGVYLDKSIYSACNIAEPKAYFEYNSADLKGNDVSTLDDTAKCLASGPLKGKTIEIVGHTDERGDAEYNKALGHSRAQTVADYLAGKGIDKAKIATLSKGKEEATAPPTDGHGMAYDRRVDVRLKK